MIKKPKKEKVKKQAVIVPVPVAVEEIPKAISKHSKWEEVVDDDDVLNKSRRICNAVLSVRQHRPFGFKSYDSMEPQYFEFSHFALKQLFNLPGIPAKSWLKIVGGTGIGKTTFTFNVISMLIQATNGYALYVNSEAKSHDTLQQLRHLNSNAKTALQLNQTRIEQVEAYSELDMAEKVEEWLKSMRGVTSRGKDSVCVGMHQPLIVAIDSMSKLMSTSESVGVYAFGSAAKAMAPPTEATAKPATPANKKSAAVKKKVIGEGSNFEHAKFHQEFARKIPALQAQYNVVFITTHHQNENFSMGGPASFLPASYTELYNNKHNGGRAADQNASFNLIMAKWQDIKTPANKVVGARVRVHLEKNTMGPHGNVMTFDLHTSYTADEGLYLSPSITYDQGILEWLQINKHISDLRYDNNTWTCRSLDILAPLSPKDMVLKLEEIGKFNELGKALRIPGYFNTKEYIQKWVTENGDNDLNPKIVNGYNPEIHNALPTPPAVNTEDDDDGVEPNYEEEQ